MYSENRTVKSDRWTAEATPTVTFIFTQSNSHGRLLPAAGHLRSGIWCQRSYRTRLSSGCFQPPSNHPRTDHTNIRHR